MDEWLSWNDLNFYNELLDIAEFSQNKALQKAAIFTIPGLEQLFDISVKMLGLKNPENKLSLEDKNFLRRLIGIYMRKMNLQLLFLILIIGINVLNIHLTLKK